MCYHHGHRFSSGLHVSCCLLWCPRRPGARCNVYKLELDLECGAGTCQGRGERALVPAHTHTLLEITTGTVFYSRGKWAFKHLGLCMPAFTKHNWLTHLVPNGGIRWKRPVLGRDSPAHGVLQCRRYGRPWCSKWLRCCASNAGGLGLIPCLGTKIPHAARCSQN